jgi:hypothetical protein
MHRTQTKCLAAAALLSGLSLLSRRARADDATVLAADLDVTGGIQERGVTTGQGGNIRLGHKFDAVILSLTPEFGVAYHRFAGLADARLTQGIVGARVRVGKVIEPGAYAHIGYGSLDVNGAAASMDSMSGLSADAGVLLDLTLLPVLDLGLHAGYNGLLASGDRAAFDTYVLGLNVGLVF